MASSQTRAGCILSPSISLNCAFARVAFRELSKETYDQRIIQFKELFCDYPGFCLPDSYFTDSGKKKPSQFERDFAKKKDLYYFTIDRQRSRTCLTDKGIAGKLF